MSRGRRLLAGLGLAAALAATAAAAQQPQPQPQPPAGLPQGHPPVPMPGVPAGQPAQAQPGQPGQPGQPPIRQLPLRPSQAPPGRPIGPGGHQFPPGARPIPLPGQGGRGVPAHEAEHSAHGAGHCPGHGPNDPPPHPNWWYGLLGINNEKAEQGGVSHVLWRYNDPKDPCNPKNEPPPFLASVINFGVLVFVIYRFGRKPISEALVKRKQAIMHEIDNATRLKKEAEERLTEYETKLEHLEDTLEQMKTEYAAQAELEKKNLLAELEERRARMRRDAEFRIEQELKGARVELLQEAVRNAVAAAEQLLRQRATKEDLDRMAEDYLRSIPTAVGLAGAARAPAPGSESPGAGT